MKNLSVILILLTVFMSNVVAQRGKVSASLEIQADSIAIGEALLVTVQVDHPSEAVIEFPTSRDFSPFELIRGTASPTLSEDGLSRDQVQYEVRTFSLSPRQQLDLPILWYNGRDTGQIRLLSDTFFLKRQIPQVNDSLEYRFTLTPVDLKDPPNYLSFLLVVFFVLLLTSLIVFALRKPARRYWALRSLNRSAERMRKALERLSREQNQEIQLETLNSLWRSFLDPEQDIQLGAMTTTELSEGVQKLSYLNIEDQKALLEAARLRDQVSFAGHAVGQSTISATFTALQRVVDRVYKHRKSLIQGAR